MSRHLTYRLADGQTPARLVVMESTGEEYVTLTAPCSFRRIQRHGRWFLLAGADRATGEMVYLPEEEIA